MLPIKVNSEVNSMESMEKEQNTVRSESSFQSLLTLITSCSGKVFNQLWLHNVLKEEEKITDSLHLAYYKDNRAQTALYSELESFGNSLYGNKISGYAIQNFFSNCYCSDVKLP